MDIEPPSQNSNGELYCYQKDCNCKRGKAKQHQQNLGAGELTNYQMYAPKVPAMQEILMHEPTYAKWSKISKSLAYF